MPREFDDAQGQRWTARQVGIVLDQRAADEPEPGSLPAKSAGHSARSCIDVEFRAATGTTVHSVLADVELDRATEDDLRAALEKGLDNRGHDYREDRGQEALI